MAVEASVENKICQSCGADGRSGAMFCYNCGSAVAPELQSENGRENNGGKENNIYAADNEISESKTEIEIGKLIEKPVAEPLIKKDKAAGFEKAVDIKNKNLVVEKESVLKTAAAVKRQTKPQTKNVEVFWEEENSANALFIVAAVILTLFAVGALLAMMYLR